MKNIATLASSFLIGLLFSIGLSISGMVNPNIVLGFLDIFGNWDARLIFVMGGALLVSVPSFIFIYKKRKQSILGYEIPSAPPSKTDKSLIIGSSIFGLGWGITGICPGPGIANIFLLNDKVIVFILCMLVGMLISKYLIIGKNNISN